MKTRFVFLIGTVFIMLLFAIGTIKSNAQSSIVVNGETIEQVTDTDLEKVVDKYIAQTGDAINEILASVKTNFTDEAEFVWKSYIKMYKLNFFIALSIFGLGVILLLGAFIMYWVTDWDWDEGPGVLLVVSIVIMLGGTIASIACIPYLLVPEVYVIQDLLGLVR